MEHAKIVILKGHSLFVEGVISRLQELSDHIDLTVVDFSQPDALDQVVTIRPFAVILDASDPDIIRGCSLSKLLKVLPALKVIRLDSESPYLQVIQWEEKMAYDVRSLISVITPPERRP